MRTMTSRAIAAAAVAIALTTMSLQPAAANGRYNNGDAAAAAAIVGIFGTVAALIAANSHRHHYGPVYGAPVYGGPAYGPRGGQWRHHYR